MDLDAEPIAMLRERHKCPYFRILVIGRANAGKTTILENVCGVAQGTKPIIYDEHGVNIGANIKPKPGPNLKSRFKLPMKWSLNRKPVSCAQTVQHLMPSMEVSHRVKHVDLYPLMCNQFQRGVHDIEHQVTYPGSNFVFHDSEGFEAGGSKEIETVWKFIEKRSTAIEVKNQLHAIWYLILILYIPG
jgi:hypothetical protein